MKTYRSKAGPFTERPYFEAEEIERTCLEELRAAGLYPKEPEAIRIDRYIEKRFGVTPSYEDLGTGVLGLTKFGRKGVIEVVIARSLDEDRSTSSERRVRTTLAHEAGHGVLHSYLFTVTGQCSLFPDGSGATPMVLCRDENSNGARGEYKGQWWEFQANKAIGAFLLPRPLVNAALDDFMMADGLLGGKTLDNERRANAVRLLAEVFDVNAIVARLRLEEVYPLKNLEQPSL
jgi:hypothetical protein